MGAGRRQRVSAVEPAAPESLAGAHAPQPLSLAWSSPPLLAAGTELKNTFCLAQDHRAHISAPIGDLKTFETLQAYEAAIEQAQRQHGVQPELIAYDLHPDYLATRYALQRAEEGGLPTVAVQHHHAHIAACMAEHSLPDEPVIGFSFDGTGYGSDGAIWGGEVLVAGYARFERPFHLSYVPLPGGDLAVRQPWRMALAWLRRAEIERAADLPPVQAAEPQALAVVEQQISTGLNAPPTSSLGRLFDAVAAFIGLRSEVEYEAQAAIELEASIDPDESGAYEFAVEDAELDAAPMWRALLADFRAGTAPGAMAARFHNSLADLVLIVSQKLRQERDLNRVVLSGGVWQNAALLQGSLRRLDAAGFEVFSHQHVPTSDSGVSLGQAAVAYHVLRK